MSFDGFSQPHIEKIFLRVMSHFLESFRRKNNRSSLSVLSENPWSAGICQVLRMLLSIASKVRKAHHIFTENHLHIGKLAHYSVLYQLLFLAINATFIFPSPSSMRDLEQPKLKRT